MADSIEEVKSKTDIVGIIGERIELKRAGRNYKALCPFHGEKTPSFMINPELQIYKCFGCFPAGQYIKTPFGYHKIEDIVEGEYAISGKGEIQKVLVTHERQYVGDLVTVKLSQLTEPVELTSGHFVYTIGGAPLYSNCYKYLSLRLNQYKKYSVNIRRERILNYFPVKKTPAGQLRKGMTLLYPINKTIRDMDSIDLSQYITKKWPNHGTKPLIPNLEVGVDKEFLKLIGYYVAEGSNNRAFIRFSLGNHEEDFAKEIVRLIKKIFDLDAKICRRKGLRRTGLEISACNSILANVFANLCGKGAENKHVPFVFQQLPPKKQRIIFNAIHKGDGFDIKPRGRVKSRRKAITTISRTLSEQLVDILLRNGCFPSRNTNKDNFDKLGVHHRKAFTVSWSVDPKVSKYHHFYETEEGKVYWLLPVFQVSKKRFVGKVYNLTIDNDHSYVANNFAVANCGEAGDVFNFLESYEGMEFGEALKYLADRAGVELKPLSFKTKSDKERLYEINELSAKFYHFVLTSHRAGKEALDYLKKERGIGDDLIQEFQLGYSPNIPFAAKKFLVDKHKISTAELIKTGLVYKGERGTFDRFRGRVIFPLFDHRGNVIGFAGRILPKDQNKDLAKYINTPETPVYHKGSVLYGLNLSRSEIKRKNEAVVVEGELDLISSWKAGIKNIVALKGTAMTEDQIRLLSRFTQKIILMLDADIAGDLAARRGITIAQNLGMEVRVLELKGFKDPDEAAKSDPVGLKKSLKNAVGVWDFIIDSIFAKQKASSGLGTAKISREIVPILGQIEDKIVQAHYIKIVADKLGVPENAVKEQIEESFKKGTVKRIETESVEEVKKSRRILLEERLLTLAFQSDPKVLLKSENSELILGSLTGRIYDNYVIYSKKVKKWDPAKFVKTLPSELVEGFNAMMLAVTQPGGLEKELAVVIRELKTLYLKERLNEVTSQIRQLESKGETDKLQEVQGLFAKYSAKLSELEGKSDIIG